MQGVTLRDNFIGDVEKVVPWVKENALRDALEQKRRERFEVLQVLLKNEEEALRALPKEARDIVKVPDPETFLEDL